MAGNNECGINGNGASVVNSGIGVSGANCGIGAIGGNNAGVDWNGRNNGRPVEASEAGYEMWMLTVEPSIETRKNPSIHLNPISKNLNGVYEICRDPNDEQSRDIYPSRIW